MDIKPSAPNLLPMPPVLQKWQWVTDPIGYMEGAAKLYPDIFTAEVVGFGGELVFINHPEAIQEILTNDRKTFTAPGDLNQILSPLLGDYSVIMLDGDRHKRRRQLLMPPFHGDRMKAYGQIIRELTLKAFQTIPVGQSFVARHVTQEISLQVMLQAVYGVCDEVKNGPLTQAVTALSDTFRSPLSSTILFFEFLQRDWGAWSPWGRFLRVRQKLDEMIYAEIRDRRANPDPDRIDILSLLMAAQDETGQPMTEKELRDELSTLMFAGHETTATAMAWALYWVHRLPAVREKLLRELATVDLTDSMSVARLPYLTAVCNETLRIYPVAMLTFPRLVQEPVEMLGHQLNPGTILLGSMYLVHQREDLYPEPKTFNPERFLERQFSPYEFMPFGGGVRRCIGEALAQFELKLALATVLTHYEMELAETKPEVPRRRGVTLAPKGGVKMVIRAQRKVPPFKSEEVAAIA
jgi:cytochrome P450